jgi:hypothetical protein
MRELILLTLAILFCAGLVLLVGVAIAAWRAR